MLIKQPLALSLGSSLRNVPFIPILCLLACFLDSVKLRPRSLRCLFFSHRTRLPLNVCFCFFTHFSFHKHLWRPYDVPQSLPYPSKCLVNVGLTFLLWFYNNNSYHGLKTVWWAAMASLASVFLLWVTEFGLLCRITSPPLRGLVV